MGEQELSPRVFEQLEEANKYYYKGITKEELEQILNPFKDKPEEGTWSHFTAEFNEKGEYISFALDPKNMFVNYTLPSGVKVEMQIDPMHVKEDHVMFLDPLKFP